MGIPMCLQRRDFKKLGLSSILLGMLGFRAEGNPPVSQPRSSDNLRQANNRFAVTFLQKVESRKPGENQVVSPFSIETALLMTMEGARGKTAAEMGATLGLPSSLQSSDSQRPWRLDGLRNDIQTLLENFGPKDANLEKASRLKIQELRARLNMMNDQAQNWLRSGKYEAAAQASREAKALADQINQMAMTIDQYELSMANSVWAEQSYKVEQEFAKTVQQYYGAGVRNVDFKNSAETQRATINRWVSDHTQQKIKELIPLGAINAMTRMVLANAIYFRGTWQQPFAESRTATKSFYNSGTLETQVPMMSQWRDQGRYAAFNSDGTAFPTPKTLPEGTPPEMGYPKDGVQLIELDYNGGDLSMLVILPTKRTGLTAVIDKLSPDLLERWENALAVRTHEVNLPKFKLEVTYELNDALQRQGMVAAFDADRADFSGIGSEGLFISRVLHKAFIEVNEKGTEAAAATAVLMAPTSARPREIPFHPKFVADHPFLFLIRHRPSGLVLFLGKVERL